MGWGRRGERGSGGGSPRWAGRSPGEDRGVQGRGGPRSVLFCSVLFRTRGKEGEGCGSCRAEGQRRRAGRGNAARGGDGAVTAPPHTHFLASHLPLLLWACGKGVFRPSHGHQPTKDERELDNRDGACTDRPCPRKPGRQLPFRGPAAGLLAWGVATGIRGVPTLNSRHPVSKAVQITGCTHT